MWINIIGARMRTPGDLGLERTLELAVEMRDVGRGAAHIETNKVLEASLAPGFRHAHYASRRT